MKKNINFNIGTIINNIKKYESEIFTQIEGGTFTYKLNGKSLEFSRTNHKLPLSEINKAIDLLPLKNTVAIQHLRCPSYIFAILTDKRIINNY